MTAICILTKNNESTIKKCLDSVCKLNCRVLVIDGGSKDKTLEIVKEYNVFIQETSLNIGAARQFAIEQFLDEIIIFVDSDVELPDNNNWLSAMLEPFSDPEVALTWTQETTKPEYPLISKYCVNEVNRAQAIGMGHTAVKRTAVQMSGGFLGLPAGEDIDLIKRLVKNGYKIICVDQPVYHNHAISFKQYWNKYKRNLQFTPIENYNHLKFIKYAIIPPKFDKTLFLHPLITFLKCAAIYETSEPLKLLSIGLAIVLFLIIFIVFPINNAILLYVILSSAIFFLWWFICY